MFSKTALTTISAFFKGDILSFGQSFDELRLVHPALLLGGVRRSPYRGWQVRSPIS